MKRSFRLLSFILCFALILAFCACSGETETNEGENSSVSGSTAEPTAQHTKVKMTVKDFGAFIIELYPEYAPQTVANFIKLVNGSFYEGTIFHRVVDGFMAQGGAGTDGKTAEPIKGEFASNGFASNTLKHTKGVISMARTTDPDSATSQFFICYSDQPSLDGDYAAFGKVIEGMDVVEKFQTVERTANALGEIATPVEDIVIESAEVLS